MQCYLFLLSIFFFSLFLSPSLSLPNRGVRSDDDEDENGGGKDSELMAKVRAFFSDPLPVCLDNALSTCKACDPSCRNICTCKAGKSCSCVGDGVGKLCTCK